MDYLLCWLGLHPWKRHEKWFPSFSAPIITRFECHFYCSCCGKQKEPTVFEFGAEGMPVEPGV